MVIFATEYTATFFDRHNISLFVYCLLVNGYFSGALRVGTRSAFAWYTFLFSTTKYPLS